MQKKESINEKTPKISKITLNAKSTINVKRYQNFKKVSIFVSMKKAL